MERTTKPKQIFRFLDSKQKFSGFLCDLGSSPLKEFLLFISSKMPGVDHILSKHFGCRDRDNPIDPQS